MPSSERAGPVRRLAVLLVLLAVAGCAAGPELFPPPPGPNVLGGPVADGGGIIVLGISGAPGPVASGLQEAMVEAMAARDIPAATEGGNRRSRFLQGWATVEPRPGGLSRVEIVWELTDPAGRPVGSQPMSREVPAASWERADPMLLRTLAESAAPAIAALIQEPAPRDAGTDRNPLHVWPVAGLPEGDGTALRRAMEAALRQGGYTIEPELADGTLVVAGSVRLGAPTGGQRRIEIVWAVLDGAGRELGRLAQDNMLPVGDGMPGVGAVAPDIAAAAAGGVAEILERLPPRPAGGPGSG